MRAHSPAHVTQRRKPGCTIKKGDFQWYGLIVVISLLIYFASQALLPYYIYGDQYYYINFYHAVKQAGASSVPQLQLLHTGSSEPLYGYTTWLFANLGFEKNTYISLANALLTVVAGLALKKSGAKPIVFLFIVTNFYFVVLLTSAERLKFSYIFFALIFVLPRKTRFISGLIAPLFHFQTVINYVSLLLGRFAEVRVKEFRKVSTLAPLIALAVIAAFGVNYLVEFYGGALLSKYDHYSRVATFEPNHIIRIVALLILGLVCGVRISALLAYMLPIAVGVVFLGPERVNMIGFVTILFVAAKYGKLMNPLFLLLLSYFSFKTIDYISNILTHQTGFL